MNFIIKLNEWRNDEISVNFLKVFFFKSTSSLDTTIQPQWPDSFYLMGLSEELKFRAQWMINRYFTKDLHPSNPEDICGRALVCRWDWHYLTHSNWPPPSPLPGATWQVLRWPVLATTTCRALLILSQGLFKEPDPKEQNSITVMWLSFSVRQSLLSVSKVIRDHPFLDSMKCHPSIVERTNSLYHKIF